MQQAENYQLSLWNKEDRILMGIFHEEDHAIGTAPAACAKIAAEDDAGAGKICQGGPQA